MQMLRKIAEFCQLCQLCNVQLHQSGTSSASSAVRLECPSRRRSRHRLPHHAPFHRHRFRRGSAFNEFDTNREVGKRRTMHKITTLGAAALCEQTLGGCSCTDRDRDNHSLSLTLEGILCGLAGGTWDPLLHSSLVKPMLSVSAVTCSD